MKMGLVKSCTHLDWVSYGPFVSGLETRLGWLARGLGLRYALYVYSCLSDFRNVSQLGRGTEWVPEFEREGINLTWSLNRPPSPFFPYPHLPCALVLVWY